MYKTYGWKCEKGYSEYAETRGDYFSHPRLWDGITVSDCGYGNLKERKKFFSHYIALEQLPRSSKFLLKNLKKKKINNNIYYNCTKIKYLHSKNSILKS